MTDPAPIPTETFDTAVDRLDRDALAAFVGRLKAAAHEAADVEVDPPVVIVDDGDSRKRLLVAPGGDGADADGSAPADPPADAVVAAPGASTATDPEVPVRTTADLRQQLLYAASPEVAESIAEEWLETPARSASYAPEPTPTAAAGGDPDADGVAAGAERNPGPPGESDAPTTPDSSASTTPDSGASTTPDGLRRSPPTGDRGGSGTRDAPSDAASTRSGVGFAVVGVLIVLIIAVAGGVVYAAEVSPDGDAGAFAAAAPADDGATTDDGSITDDEDGAAATPTPTLIQDEGDGSGVEPLVSDTEVDRNVRPGPTCDRSFLNVVQVQMNALKYNNDTTNDGIRTVRRFASPRNRQTIQSFEEFVRVIKGPTYSPMLSYESAQYTPLQSSDDYAQVEVVTREDGNVTGRYYFRLGKVDRGEYDGCWMTDAVVSVPETTDFSGRVAGRSTGATNGTS